jgi:hypothetical protein
MQLWTIGTTNQNLVVDDFYPVGLIHTPVLLEEEWSIVMSFGMVE